MRVASFVFSLFVWPLVILVTLFFSLAAIVVTPLAPRGRPSLYLARWWGRIALVLAGVRLRVEGREGLDLEQSYVIMVNHESTVDIPAVIAALPSRLGARILAKQSLFSIPFLGWAMSALGFVAVDRQDRSTAPDMFREAVDKVSGGNSILLFPEETRTGDGRLLPLQRGGFLLALKTRLPILPVGIEGARIALPAKRRVIRPLTRVTVRIGEPIPTRDLPATSRRELMAVTRREIDRLRGPRGHISDAEAEAQPTT